MVKNKNNSNSNNIQMDDFLNMMLREEVKRYKKIKSNTNPDITIKENFIFEITKKASILYVQEINNRKIKRNKPIYNR